MGNRYTNSFYKNEARDFIFKKDKKAATSMYIKPDFNDASYITKSMLDSFLRAGGEGV